MAITAADVARVRKEREQNRNGHAPLEGKWQAGDVAKVRRESAAAKAGGFAQRRELDDELYTRRTGRPAAGTMPNRTRTNDEDEPGGLLGGLMRVMQRNTEINNSRAYRTEEIRQEAEEVLGRPARENEARYNAYNQWLEEGDNREILSALVNAEQAARRVPSDQVDQYIMDDLLSRGYSAQEIQDVQSRREEYEQSVPFGYDITHRIASSVEGIASQAAGAAFMAPETLRQALYNIVDRQRLNTGDESHDELLKAVERVRKSNGMYTLEELARNNDRGWTAEDIAAAEAELDGAAAPVDMSGPGGRLYQQGEEALQEARLGLSDLQKLAYGAAESAGENIALGLINPGLLLAEQTLRSAGAGIADTADAGMSAGQSLLSGLGHGAISAGIEQIGIGQMMRNMGMRTGMAPAVDAALDRIASLPGMNRLPSSLAGIVANAGEEATEEFVQSYADAALDNLLGAPNTPGLLSGDLLNQALQSAAGGATGGALIGGISSAIGQAQTARRFQPRADEVANNQLTAAIQQAGRAGQMQQAAAMEMIQNPPETNPVLDLAPGMETSQTAEAAQPKRNEADASDVLSMIDAVMAENQKERSSLPTTENVLAMIDRLLYQNQNPEQTVQKPAGIAEDSPQPKIVDNMLDELTAQSGGRLDASAWEMLRDQSQQKTQQTARERYQEQRQQARVAARQAWDETQRQEARLMAENTTMSEAAVNTAVEAMPADVSGEVYALASNSMYQLARQGLVESADEALELAARSGVRVNQILAAPGGAEALQQVFNQGLMEGLEADGYGQAGLADAARAGTVEYEDNVLIPEEDRALIDLFAAASDTAVTVRQKLENDAGGYVDTALGQVFFGAESGADTFGTILHESNHWYNAWDAAGGRELQTELLKYQTQQMGFENVDAMVQQYIQEYQQAGEPLSYAQACEEITSDALRGVFDTEESFRRWVDHQQSLAQQNASQRGTLQNVMDAVRDLLDKVISKAKSILSRTPDNAAAKQAQNLAESQKRVLEDLYYKHAAAAMEAERNARPANENEGSTNKRYHISMESESQKIRRQIEGYDAQIESLKVEREEVKKQKEEWEASEEVERFKEKEKEAKKHGLFSAEFKAFKETEEYKNWVKKRKSFNSKIVEIDHTIELLRTQVAELGSNAAKSKKSNDAELQIKYDAMAAQNGGKAEYRRKLAKEKFGTTENFYQAGYVLPDGSMLNFAQNADTRDSDHREIIDVFGPAEVKIGTDAMNQFIADGNVRVMAESPGIDISANTKPTAQQLNKIRDMAETLGADKKRFMLDISDENGKVVASKTYSGRINADKVVREISEYYRSGKLPAESDLAQFRYQLPVDQRAESGGLGKHRPGRGGGSSGRSFFPLGNPASAHRKDPADGPGFSAGRTEQGK